MTFRVRVRGLDGLKRKLRALPVEHKRGMGRALSLSALDVQGTAQRNIQRGARTGRVYPAVRGRRGRPHRASAPGEFPKTDTGRLVSSIFAEVDMSSLVADVGTDIRYGPFLEFGTSKMAARPWLQPSFDERKEAIAARFRAAGEAANRRGARR